MLPADYYPGTFGSWLEDWSDFDGYLETEAEVNHSLAAIKKANPNADTGKILEMTPMRETRA